MLLMNSKVLGHLCQAIRPHVAEWSSQDLAEAIKAAFVDRPPSRHLPTPIKALLEDLDNECAARLQADISKFHFAVLGKVHCYTVMPFRRRPSQSHTTEAASVAPEAVILLGTE